MEKDAQFIDPIMWSAFLLAFVLALLCIHGTAFRTRLNPWSSPSMLKNELRSNSVEVSQVKNKDTCGTDLGDYLTVAKKQQKSKARVMTP